MTYIYDCDGWCNDDENPHHDRPALMCEFNERWFKSSSQAGQIAEEYDPGDVVTLCGDCVLRLLQHD